MTERTAEDVLAEALAPTWRHYSFVGSDRASWSPGLAAAILAALSPEDRLILARALVPAEALAAAMERAWEDHGGGQEIPYDLLFEHFAPYVLAALAPKGDE